MEGGHHPRPGRYSSRGEYSGWDRRDTRNASSSGYEDKRADWSNIGDRGNDHATVVDTGKNKDKDDTSRTGKEKEVDKGKEKEKQKGKEREEEREEEKGRDRLREKFVNVTKEDLWALQRVTGGKAA